MLDLNRARVLCEVARLGSMTAAARALSFTQPAVSHHIARLEAEAGTPLVIRHGRGVRLTEAGRILVEHVEDVLARTADVEERIAAVAGLRAGRVRAAVFPTAAAALLPDALVRLRRRAPGVAVTLTEAEPPQALDALRTGEADLAVTFAYPHTLPDDDTRLRQIPLGEDPVHLALPADHPLAGADRLTLADLARDTWASGCQRCRGHLLHACAAAGFTPAIAFATDDHVAVQRLVSCGLAVTALPGLALALHDEPGVVRRTVPELGRRRIHALVPAGPRPPAVTALLEELVAVAAEVKTERPSEKPALPPPVRGRSSS